MLEALEFLIVLGITVALCVVVFKALAFIIPKILKVFLWLLPAAICIVCWLNGLLFGIIATIITVGVYIVMIKRCIE